MKTLTLSFVNGQQKQFSLSEADISKIQMALENVSTIWFLIQDFKFRPEALVSIEVK
jgi:hypothetical protein